MKVFDVLLGSVVILFGAGIAYFFLKSLDFSNLVLNRKLVIGIVVPGAILLTGVQRILKKRSPPK